MNVEQVHQKGQALHTYDSRIAKTPKTCCFEFTLQQGRKISAELHEDVALLFDGDKAVCRITFSPEYSGRGWSYPIVRRALNGLMSKAGKACRYRKNRLTDCDDGPATEVAR